MTPLKPTAGLTKPMDHLGWAGQFHEAQHLSAYFTQIIKKIRPFWVLPTIHHEPIIRLIRLKTT